ncbi:MAG: hypothetical protein SPL42_09935, partial [Bacteroidales bacterium]|nr:hypothetical protein [Bacteroidales bacterium]
MDRKIPIKKFSFRIMVFSVIVAGAAALFQWLLPQYASPALPFIVLFFFLITLFTIYVVLRNDNPSNQRQFLSGYMLSRIVKLMSCLLFLTLYIFLNKKDSIRFAIGFLVIYFLYAVFEVFLLKKENDDMTKKYRQNTDNNDFSI